MDEKLSRRDVLQKSAALGVFALVGTAACGKSGPKGPVCTDTSALSTSDATVRQTLGYVDVSMEPGKACNGCQQFVPAAPNACGTCKVLRGPINPYGYCKSFVAKTS